MHGVYDDQDRMLSYGGSEYIYNAQGSLITNISGTDTTCYTYDLMGNLLSVSLPNGDEIEYIIDPQNRRTGKILNGMVVKKWIYQDQLNPVAELDGNDSLLARFVYGSKAHVPDYILKSDTTYRVVTDHLGSVRAVVNVVTGAVVQEISYNEFGVVLWNTNPEFHPFAYAGGLYDVSTGLVRFGARDYDCFTGRWTAKDPIGFGGGINHFVYCRNNPINWVDNSGQNPAFWGALMIVLQLLSDLEFTYKLLLIADEIATDRLIYGIYKGYNDGIDEAREYYNEMKNLNQSAYNEYLLRAARMCAYNPCLDYNKETDNCKNEFNERFNAIETTIGDWLRNHPRLPDIPERPRIPNIYKSDGEYLLAK